MFCGMLHSWLSKPTAFSMCHYRQITPGRYKGTRRQSKAVVSTGVDSGQPLDLIKAFEPESCSRPPFVTPFQPLLSLAAEGSSLFWPYGEPRKESISARERSKEDEWNSPDQILVNQCWLLKWRPGQIWPQTLDLECRKKADKCVCKSLHSIMMTAACVAKPYLSLKALTICMFSY